MEQTVLSLTVPGRKVSSQFLPVILIDVFGEQLL